MLKNAHVVPNHRLIVMAPHNAPGHFIATWMPRSTPYFHQLDPMLHVTLVYKLATDSWNEGGVNASYQRCRLRQCIQSVLNATELGCEPGLASAVADHVG